MWTLLVVFILMFLCTYWVGEGRGEMIGKREAYNEAIEN